MVAIKSCTVQASCDPSPMFKRLKALLGTTTSASFNVVLHCIVMQFGTVITSCRIKQMESEPLSMLQEL